MRREILIIQQILCFMYNFLITNQLKLIKFKIANIIQTP